MLRGVIFHSFALTICHTPLLRQDTREFCYFAMPLGVQKREFNLKVQRFLKGNQVLYFNAFGYWENLGREYARGDSPIQSSPSKTLKIYEPPDSKSHELPVALTS